MRQICITFTSIWSSDVALDNVLSDIRAPLSHEYVGVDVGLWFSGGLTQTYKEKIKLNKFKMAHNKSDHIKCNLRKKNYVFKKHWEVNCWISIFLGVFRDKDQMWLS